MVRTSFENFDAITSASYNSPPLKSPPIYRPNYLKTKKIHPVITAPLPLPNVSPPPSLLTLKWIQLFTTFWSVKKPIKFKKYFDQRCYVACFEKLLRSDYKPPPPHPREYKLLFLLALLKPLTKLYNPKAYNIAYIICAPWWNSFLCFIWSLIQSYVHRLYPVKYKIITQIPH